MVEKTDKMVRTLTNSIMARVQQQLARISTWKCANKRKEKESYKNLKSGSFPRESAHITNMFNLHWNSQSKSAITYLLWTRLFLKRQMFWRKISLKLSVKRSLHLRLCKEMNHHWSWLYLTSFVMCARYHLTWIFAVIHTLTKREESGVANTVRVPWTRV